MSETAQAPSAGPPTTTAHVMYLMHAIAPFTLWTVALLALLVGALTRDSVRGTWVETHYSWLLRTCLWGLLWLVIFTFLFAITIIGLFVLFLPWFVLTVWYLYRVIRGWLRLNDRRPAPA